MTEPPKARSIFGGGSPRRPKAHKAMSSFRLLGVKPARKTRQEQIRDDFRSAARAVALTAETNVRHARSVALQHVLGAERVNPHGEILFKKMVGEMKSLDDDIKKLRAAMEEARVNARELSLVHADIAQVLGNFFLAPTPSSVDLTAFATNTYDNGDDDPDNDNNNNNSRVRNDAGAALAPPLQPHVVASVQGFVAALGTTESRIRRETLEAFLDTVYPILDGFTARYRALVAKMHECDKAENDLVYMHSKPHVRQDETHAQNLQNARKLYHAQFKSLYSTVERMLQNRFVQLRPLVSALFTWQTTYHQRLHAELDALDKVGDEADTIQARMTSAARMVKEPSFRYGNKGNASSLVASERKRSNTPGSFVQGAFSALFRPFTRAGVGETSRRLNQRTAELLFGAEHVVDADEAKVKAFLLTFRAFIQGLKQLDHLLARANAQAFVACTKNDDVCQALRALFLADSSPVGVAVMGALETYAQTEFIIRNVFQTISGDYSKHVLNDFLDVSDLVNEQVSYLNQTRTDLSYFLRVEKNKTKPRKTPLPPAELARVEQNRETAEDVYQHAHEELVGTLESCLLGRLAKLQSTYGAMLCGHHALHKEATEAYAHLGHAVHQAIFAPVPVVGMVQRMNDSGTLSEGGLSLGDAANPGEGGGRSTEPQVSPNPWDRVQVPYSDYKLIVIGETGCGKSTLINTICNFLRRGTLDNLKVLIPTKFHPKGNQHDSQGENEHDVGNVMHSQTIDCKEYRFSLRGRTITVIDTPGLADTKGVGQDDANIEQVLKTCAEAGQLQGVVLVFNGTLCRVTNTMKTVMTRFRNNLPDVILPNILVVFTNCTKLKCNFKPEVIEEELLGGSKIRRLFYMQNSVFSSDPNAITDPESREELDRDWSQSMNTLCEVFNYTTGLRQVDSKMFQEMRTARDKLKSKMADLLAEINEMDKARKHIQAAMEKQKRAGADQVAFGNFMTQETVESFVQEETTYHNTNCAIHRCTCHEHCGVQKVDGQGAQELTGCMAFTNDVCTSSCPPGDKCSRVHHYHDNKKWIKQSRTVDKIMDDIKKKFDAARDVGSRAVLDINNGQQMLQALDDALQVRMEEIKQLCRKLKAVCRGFNLAEELSTGVDTWRAELKLLTDMATRNELQARIDTMEIFVRSLNDEAVFSAPVSLSAPPKHTASTGSKTVMRSGQSKTQYATRKGFFG